MLSFDHGFSLPFSFAAAKSAIQHKVHLVSATIKDTPIRCKGGLTIEGVGDLLFTSEFGDNLDRGAPLDVFILLNIVLLIR